jgi:hypothetical protein
MAKYTIRHDKNEISGGFLGDGKLALGITIGVISVILAFVVFEFFVGAKDPEVYLSFAPLFISLIVALASAYFSAGALLEQRKAREAGTDPVLIAHLGQREDARELVTFNISNVGAGAALKVQLYASHPSDTEDDEKKRGYLQNIFMPREPFAVVLQGQSIEFNLALGWHLLGQEQSTLIDPNLPLLVLPPFQVSLSYEDLAGGQYNSEFTIDVREMRGLGAHKSPQMRIVSALEKIAKKQ